MSAGALKDLVMNDGNKIPPFGLGTYAGNNLEHVIKAAIDTGYRLIDTAFIYNNEVEIGKALRSTLQEGKIRREDLFIVSKLWNTQHEPKCVVPSIQKCLRDLQIDYLDLYLIHWPLAMKPGKDEDACDVSKNMYYPENSNVTLEETWRAMEEVVRRGYAKSIGVSNFNKSQVERILKIATIKPVVNQVECNVYLSQEELRAFCKQVNIVVMAYSPLQGVQSPSPVIEELTRKYKKTAAQIVIRYLVQCGVVPVPKTDKLDRLKSNFQIQDFTIASEDVEKMRKLNKNQRSIPFPMTKTFKEYPFKAEF